MHNGLITSSGLEVNKPLLGQNQDDPRLSQMPTKTDPSLLEAPLKYIERLTFLDDKTPAARDVSPAAKIKRRKMFLRALYGEFICTCIFFTALFGTLANGYKRGWSEEFRVLSAALVAGLMVVSFTLAFSDMSGANCNCAISFALWITGGLSNRKAVCYIIVQLLASCMATLVVMLSFTDAEADNGAMFKALTLQPAPGMSISKIFATEFFTTYCLAYTAFAVVFEEAERTRKNQMKIQHVANDDQQGMILYASTPTSKAGFAPFCIGFVVFSLSMFGGSSGIAMNPVRMFGPALFSGGWDYFYVYTIAEFLGAGLAALMVTYIHPYGLVDNDTN